MHLGRSLGEGEPREAFLLAALLYHRVIHVPSWIGLTKNIGQTAL